MRPDDTILRLRQKHAPGPKRDAIADAERLFAEQSLKRAAGGAALAGLVLSIIWVYGSFAFDRFSLWPSIFEGVFIGRAVRYYGRGVDWRFPALAATTTVIAAWLGTFFSALFLTSREFYTPVSQLITEIGWHTISTFTTKTFGIAGTIYALTGAIIAAFFAKRRLERHEAIALRKYVETEQKTDE